MYRKLKDAAACICDCAVSTGTWGGWWTGHMWQDPRHESL